MEHRGQAARLTAARRVIITITVLVGLSIVLALAMIVIKVTTIPGWRAVTWHNTLLSLGMVVSGLLTLRWIRTALQRSLVFYALSNIAMVAIMYVLDYQAYIRNLISSYDFSSALYVAHLGILLVALIAGLRAALVTAAGGVAYLLLLSRFMPNPGMVATPIVVALILPFTAVLVERLLDEVEREAQRARLAETSLDIITHDLGSPLTVLSTSLEMLEEDDLLPGQRETLMWAIQHSTRALKSLLDEFREIPHLDGPAQMQKVGLHGIAHDVVEFHARPICERRRQTIHADLRPVEVIGSPSRLGRLMRELLTNAAKYTPSGGHIEIALWAEEQAILRVSDNGWGMEEEELAFAFERHWRGPSASEGSISGTGLGLYICKQIVEGHNGHIEVESQRGQGSTFTVYLPLAKAATASSSSDVNAISPGDET